MYFSTYFELRNGPQWVLVYVYHVGVEPQEFYPSANQCLAEGLMQVRHQGLHFMCPNKYNTDQHLEF